MDNTQESSKRLHDLLDEVYPHVVGEGRSFYYRGDDHHADARDDIRNAISDFIDLLVEREIVTVHDVEPPLTAAQEEAWEEGYVYAIEGQIEDNGYGNCRPIRNPYKRKDIANE